MSASLDDLEPYEIFQQELEEYLKEYKNEKVKISIINQLYLLHSFIEYFCFINAKSNFNEIRPEEISKGYTEYLNKKYSHQINQHEIKSSIHNFLKFIDSKFVKLSDELLNT